MKVLRFKIFNSGPPIFLILKLFQEFWFTAAATFGYFTAFIAMLADFVGMELDGYQYWVDANIAAGVSSHNRRSCQEG